MSSCFLAFFLLVLALVSTRVVHGATNTVTTSSSPSPSVLSTNTLTLTHKATRSSSSSLTQTRSPTLSWSISLPSMTAAATASHTYTPTLSASLTVSPPPTGTRSSSVTPSPMGTRSETRTERTGSSSLMKTTTVQLTPPPILYPNNTNGTSGNSTNSSRIETLHTNQTILTCNYRSLTRFTTRPSSLQLKILLEYDHGIVNTVTPRYKDPHGDPLMIPNGTFEIWNEDESVKLGPVNTTSFSDFVEIHVAGAFWVYATLEASIDYTPRDIEGVQVFISRRLSVNATEECEMSRGLCEAEDLELESGVPWTFSAISVAVSVVSLISGQVLKRLAKKEIVSQQTFIRLSFVSCLSIVVTRCLMLYLVYNYVAEQPDAAYCDVDFNCPGQAAPEEKDPPQWVLILFIVYYTVDFIFSQVALLEKQRETNSECSHAIGVPARFITDQGFSLGIDIFFVSARADDGVICVPESLNDVALSQVGSVIMLVCLCLWGCCILSYILRRLYIILCTSDDDGARIRGERNEHWTTGVLHLRTMCLCVSTVFSIFPLIVRLINITEYIVIPAVAQVLTSTIPFAIAATMGEVVQGYGMVSED